MNEIFVKDLHIGQFIQTENGLEEVIACKCLDLNDNMYDAELDSTSNHRYYTNGILSHNTTCYTVFCMWIATLFPEKKIMICANKLQTAIEIMDRMRLAYEYLP
nr:MAG TPA: Terminase [Caudoviricetes sp.]